MKQLILVRHAKSDWADASLPDIERPLNERGKKDAPLMAQRLLTRNISIDAFISSPARRAKKTAGFFAKAYKLDKSDVILVPRLYEAGTDDFYKTIEEEGKKGKTMAIFSHNFGITDFANVLTTTRIDTIPTCGIFAVKADCGDWKDFRSAVKEFWFFDYPKSSE